MSQATNLARVWAETAGIVARHHERLGTRVGADAEGVRQFGQERQNERAAAGAEVGDAQRSRARAVHVDRCERSLDDGFRFRSRHQRRGIDAQWQAPEFLVPDNARDRLAGEATVRQSGDGVFLIRAKPARGSRGERRMIEAKRVADQDTGVEFGRVEARGAKFCRQRTPRRGNSARIRAVGFCKTSGGIDDWHQFTSSAASSAAWFSATSASMISPSASPSRICGSL